MTPTDVPEPACSFMYMMDKDVAKLAILEYEEATKDLQRWLRDASVTVTMLISIG